MQDSISASDPPPGAYPNFPDYTNGEIAGGEHGDEGEVDVVLRRYVELEVGPYETRLTARNARLLGQALIAAANDLDGGARST